MFFGAVNLTKNGDPHKYSFSSFLIPNLDFGKNVIIFGVDNSLSTYKRKKNNEILVIGEGLTQGLNNDTITAKAKYFFSFTVSKNKFCLSVHYNRSNGFSMLME